MADITILRRLPGQQIPRPMNRACSLDEVLDLMTMGRSPLVRVAELTLSNVDTDAPIARRADGVEFFAFTEER